MARQKTKRRRSATVYVAAAFFIAVLAYLGVYLYRSIGTPLRTVTATRYTLYDSVNVDGLLVREETVLETASEMVYIVPDEGERVSAGGEVAIAYHNSGELALAEEARQIELQIEQLEQLRTLQAETSDLARLDETIKADILAMRRAAEQRELADTTDRAVELRTLAFNKSSDESSIDQQIRALELRLYELGDVSGNRASVLTAPVSGLFSSVVDGWEDVTPEQLMAMEPEDFTALLASEQAASEQAVGKLVSGSRWYFATVLPSETARQYAVGDTVELILGRFYSQTLSMTVERRNDGASGDSLLVLSCGTGMADTLALRVQSAELVRTEYSGLRIPRSAVHVDEDGATFVYTETGLRAERRDVQILYEQGEDYIVALDTTDAEALREGDSVIVSGKDIYDGKVIN